MKLYSFAEFLKLPNGTVFAYYDRDCVGDLGQLYVKDDTLTKRDGTHYDFVHADVSTSIDANGLEEAVELHDAAMGQVAACGISDEIPMDIGVTQREGFYDDEAIYAVYSEEEVDKIIAVLKPKQ